MYEGPGRKGGGLAATEQLIQLVRYGLETLRERNGHHEFEALCLGVARRRIASNLVPATGPVSAGGDQGRDAESHWTNLTYEIGSASVFSGMATTDRVVLACTMQRDNVPTKIRSDLTAICDASEPVDRVIYFTVTPLEVAKRHELQKEARRDHQVALDVWDARALAQALADPDLFYLAVQYLHLPSELAPEPPVTENELPDWYLDARMRWRSRTGLGNTLGELLDLRIPLRYATFHTEARADLADWLSYTRAMLDATIDREVMSRCRYEIAVATLRGTNTMLPVDDLVCAFYGEVLDTDVDPGLLHDAMVLGRYCYGAYVRGLTALTLDDLKGWHSQLQAKVQALLGQNPFPNAEAHLVALAAMLALHPRFVDVPDVDVQQLATPVEASEYVLDMLEAGEPLEISSDIEFIDRDRGMVELARLCQLLSDAPMFPIENVADYFDLVAPALADHPSYREVRDALDDAVERLAGHAAKADRARTRCMRFLGANRLLEALAEIHEAKINWWHGETLQGAVLAMLVASDVYARLRLFLAAKQYALAAAVTANSSNVPDVEVMVPRCLSLAAAHDYAVGSWLTATHVFRAAVLAQGVLVDDPTNLERHTEFADMLTYQSAILVVARGLRPALQERIESVLRSTGIDALVEPIVEGSAHNTTRSERDWARIADEGGGGRPFSDAGPTRRYSWTALGMAWTITTQNERKAVLAAERFTAAAQIILAELATEDALLLPVGLQVEIRADAHTMSASAAITDPVPGSDESRWIVHLTPIDRLDPEDFPRELGRVLVTLLMANTLLSADDFMEIIKRAFDRGLMHKLTIGRPYDETADISPADAYLAMAAAPVTSFGADLPVELAPEAELKFPTQPGPGYDRQEALERVRRRYENCTPMVQFTLPRVVDDPEFRTVISDLRGEGWLDWHLLLAMANHVGNERLKWEGNNLSTATEADARRAVRIMQRRERSIDPQIPAAAFSKKALRFSLTNSAMSTAQTMGLQFHQQPPDVAAILAVLGARYGYWTDDVDHEDLFHWSLDQSDKLEDAQPPGPST